MLTRDEELRLIELYTKDGDSEALRRLIEKYKPFILKYVKKYRCSLVSTEDLVQEGIVGFIVAVQKFRPEFKTRLATLAHFWINTQIRDFVNKNAHPVEFTNEAKQRSISTKFSRFKQKMGFYGPLNEDQIAEIAHRLGVDTNYLRRLDHYLSPETFFSFDTFLLYSKIGRFGRNKNTNFSLSTKRELSDKTPSPEELCAEKELRKLLIEGLKTLSERERDIIIQRKLRGGAYLEDLGDCYGVSRERVRQIEKAGLQKLKIFLAHNIPDASIKEAQNIFLS
ncbi:MAG: sigma-70 family RNA polymerase sigma factor [Parcubacteria group bacterium]|nr:sigma-70 family RNA polymerase sigma factor [Parcubacteria group bacterium]